MVETFVADVFVKNGDHIKSPHKAPTVFALVQSTAHQVISFYSKVGMFFYPNKYFIAIDCYERFTMKEFLSFQNTGDLKNKDDGFRCVCNVPTLFAMIVVAIKEKFIKVSINGKERIKYWDAISSKDNPLCNEYKEGNVTRSLNMDGSPCDKYWYSNIANVEFDVYIENKKMNLESISIEDMLYMFSYGVYPFQKGYHKIGGWRYTQGLGIVGHIISKILEKNFDKLKGTHGALWATYEGTSHTNRSQTNYSSERRNGGIFSKNEMKTLSLGGKAGSDHLLSKKEELSTLLRKKITRHQDQLTRMIFLQQGLSKSNGSIDGEKLAKSPYLGDLTGRKEFYEMLTKENPSCNLKKGAFVKSNKPPNTDCPDQLKVLSERISTVTQQMIQKILPEITPSDTENSSQLESNQEFVIGDLFPANSGKN